MELSWPRWRAAVLLGSLTGLALEATLATCALTSALVHDHAHDDRCDWREAVLVAAVVWPKVELARRLLAAVRQGEEVQPKAVGPTARYEVAVTEKEARHRRGT